MERKSFTYNIYDLKICLKHGKYGYFLQDDKGKTYTLYKWALEKLEKNELNEKDIKNIIDYIRKKNYEKNMKIKKDNKEAWKNIENKIYIPNERMIFC